MSNNTPSQSSNYRGLIVLNAVLLVVLGAVTFGARVQAQNRIRGDYTMVAGGVNGANSDDLSIRKAQRQGLRWNESLQDWKGKTLNELQNEGDKTWDLGWVFTVIAGALNIMVIYDALAGPAFVDAPEAAAEVQT